MIQNPGFLPDHPQNWITGSLCHSRHTLKISERSVHNFSSYLADSQTDKQTNKQTKTGKNITFLAEVKIVSCTVTLIFVLSGVLFLIFLYESKPPMYPILLNADECLNCQTRLIFQAFVDLLRHKPRSNECLTHVWCVLDMGLMNAWWALAERLSSQLNELHGFSSQFNCVNGVLLACDRLSFSSANNTREPSCH